MALESENGKTSSQESFQEFYKKWLDEQKYQLDDLVAASKTSQQPQTDSSSSLSGLVDRVIAHYEKYYRIKSRSAKTDVLLLLSPPWISALEDAFLWVGGWRPTTAFHLLYSKSGLQFEARLSDLVKGVEIGDLGDLLSQQLHLIDKLHRNVVKEEREITEKVAKHQERVADMEMVELSHEVSKASRMEGKNKNNTFDMDRVNLALKSKEEGFRKILQSADDLRLGTLKGVVDILSPIQAVHFLIAAAELQLRLHDWGKKKEDRETKNQVVS